MKKLLAMLAVIAIMVMGLAACSGGATTTNTTVKTGLGASTSVSCSDATSATVESTWAAVLLDAEGKIVQAKLDVAQLKVVPQGTDVDYRSKYEKQGDYNMAGTSPIGKEWYEQADAFCEYVVGKTADEVSAIAVEDGKTTDADLAAGCTITITSFQEAVVKACANATDKGAAADDTLTLKLTSSYYYENDVESTGYERYDTEVVALTSKDGVITSCVIDCFMGKVNAAADDGVYYTDTATTGDKTKKELGDDYGMVASGLTDKEWYVQAEAIEEYVVGKTADEVRAIADETGMVNSDLDLAATATIYVGGIISEIADAVA